MAKPPSETVRQVVGYALGYLQSAPREEPRDEEMLLRIATRADRELHIGGKDLARGLKLALQYYRAAQSARQKLAVGPTDEGAHNTISVKNLLFLPSLGSSLVGVRVYYELMVSKGVWASASVVVNVPADADLRAVVDAAVAAVVAGDIHQPYGSGVGKTTRNATIIGLSGYARNDAPTLELP